MLVYLNELVLSKTDYYALRRALLRTTPDVLLPEPGSADEQTLRTWKPKAKEDSPPLLSLPFPLKRAIRVIPITEQSIKESLAAFDETVARIEICVAKELQSGQVIASWEKNSSHEPTC